LSSFNRQQQDDIRRLIDRTITRKNNNGSGGGGGGGGVTDHGDLDGLADDDHAQYHNDTRGDARYYTKSQSDSAYAATSHSHAISDVTNLQSSLNGKADTGHTHAGTVITSGLVGPSYLGSSPNSARVLYGDNTWRNATCRPSVKTLSGSQISIGISADAAGTIAGVANAIDLAPFRCSYDLSINSIQCNVTTGVASAKVRLALYESNTDGWPTSTPVATSGVLDCATTGTKSTSISITLSGSKQYWVACWHSSTATLRGIPISGMTILGHNIGGTAQNNKVRLTSITYGDATAWRDFTSQPVNSTNLTAAAMPLICLNVP
jgi:hypothetical protein